MMERYSYHSCLKLTFTQTLIYRRVVLSALTIPFAYNISYADILDGSMKAMKKNNSDCWMSNGWSNKRVCHFLKRDATIEELAIEFDLSFRDVFNCKKLRSDDIKLARCK